MTKKTTSPSGMDVHPYPQDITADPFFVFGGLFSRKVLHNHLSALDQTSPQVFHELLRLADQCNSEKALQQGLEDRLNHHGIKCKKIDRAPTCDRIIGNRFLVEVKLDKHNNDPQFWQGSQEEENAVLQTRRYLNESADRDWALLTNGKVYRLMHKSQGLNFLDLWACDAVPSGPNAHMTMMLAALKKPEILDALLQASAEERGRFTTTFSKGVQAFWERHKKDGDRLWNVSLVEAVLCTAFHRYLEDVGILPVLSEKYQTHALLKSTSLEELIQRLITLRNQTFLTIEKVAPAMGILSDETISRIRSVLSHKEIYKEFQNLFWDTKGAIDVSDLKVAFFGDSYQLFANKTDINGVDGQYFTGSELARETAMYFVEDERRGIGQDEIIYDPFVGSGQLLRALVPFFHLLLQGELLEPSIIAGMRKLTSRVAGTDIDENACWLARLSLTLVTAERGKPLMDLSGQIIQADVFETCFGFTESRWQESLGIKGVIRGIITNPPWRRLRQTSNEQYMIETGEVAPLRANRKNWAKYQAWLKAGGRERSTAKADLLKVLSKKHKETFKRTGQREINVAISALDFVDRIKGSNAKKWVAFMPDCFFVGENDLRKQKGFTVRRYYSYPYNDHFDGTDSVMKFGVVFGGGSPQRQILCHPMGCGRVDVTAIVKRLGVLPIFGSTDEAVAQAVWFSKSFPADDWRRGEFDESQAPQKGAREGRPGVPVRGAKECNDKRTHSCIFNSESVTYWENWIGAQSGCRVLVRDKRSNTRTGKVLWAGLHIPGKNGIPKGCALSNAWNYLKQPEAEARAILHILNSPMADTAIRSIGSKRNINPKDLIKLGLPELTPEMVAVLGREDLTFVEATALICIGIFDLGKADAEKLLRVCEWLSKKERAEIIGMMDLSVQSEANKLMTAKPKKKGQITKAAKGMARR